MSIVPNKPTDELRSMVRRLGGTWSGGTAICRCPAHADRTPSFSICQGDHGILVSCHVGCDTMLRERKIALLSLEEKIDTSSAAGELIFHVSGAIAHFERRLISGRTKDGIAAARAKGKKPGRQPLDTPKLEAALTLIEAKTSPTEAAKRLGLGRSTIYREMRRLGINRPA